MDEFEWEKFMRESDERTDKYSELLDKYGDEPDSEKIIAKKMGWSWLEDALEAKERGDLPVYDGTPFEIGDPLEPNPLTEGNDWIRREDGDVRHPLTHQCSELSLKIWRLSEAVNADETPENKDLIDLANNTMTAGAKLAGALDGLGYDDDPDPGFIVARLKRALAYIHVALGAAVKLTEKNLFMPEVTRYRKELFRIRESVYDLMEKYRREIG